MYVLFFAYTLAAGLGVLLAAPHFGLSYRIAAGHTKLRRIRRLWILSGVCVEAGLSMDKARWRRNCGSA